MVGIRELWRHNVIFRVHMMSNVSYHSFLSGLFTTGKVAGSIHDGVIGIFHFGRIMALGLTQPLTEMSTRNIFWG
jgi:hypothetical protein